MQAVDAHDDMVDEGSSSQVTNPSQASLVPSSSGKMFCHYFKCRLALQYLPNVSLNASPAVHVCTARIV